MTGAEWSAWMGAFGARVRRVRQFVGWSQVQLAEAARVTQVAVSRLERGRQVGAFQTVLMVQATLAAALREMDPSLLSEDLRAIAGADGVVSFPMNGARLLAPVAKDAELEELILVYRSLPEQRRGGVVAVLRALAAGLGREKDGT